MVFLKSLQASGQTATIQLSSPAVNILTSRIHRMDPKLSRGAPGAPQGPGLRLQQFILFWGNPSHIFIVIDLDHSCPLIVIYAVLSA